MVEEKLEAFAQPPSPEGYAEEGLILLTYRSRNASLKKPLSPVGTEDENLRIYQMRRTVSQIGEKPPNPTSGRL